MHDTEQGERRSEKRAHSMASVYYSFSPEPHRDYRCYGLMMNVSESGLCMCTMFGFKEGDELEVSSNKWQGPRTATVRWCKKKITRRLYKLGLSFN